jgi:mxaA protein
MPFKPTDLRPPRPNLLAHAALAATLFLIRLPVSAAPPEPRVELAAPRDFGYVMGDLIEHRISVSVPEGYALETEFLPRPGAVADWLDIRGIEWERSGTGYRLRVTYQVLKGVKDPERLAIPPLPIRFRGADTLEAEAPGWEFVLSPIIPPKLPDEQVTVRAGFPPPTPPIAAHRLRLAAFAAGALAVALHLAGHYGFPPFSIRSGRPFARTRNELKRLAKKRPDPEVYRHALRAMHRALDETAGRTLLATHLDGFLQIRPAFVELRGDLERFFGLSQRVFFAAPHQPVPAEYPLGWLETLCRRCAMAERKTP